MRKLILFILYCTTINAQIIEPVKWETSVKKENDSIYTIYFQAKISGEWHLYSQFSDPSGAVPTEFIFNKNPSYKIIRNVQESKPIISYDNYFEMELAYFESNALFSQKVQRLSSSLEPINIELNYQACDDKLCIFRTENFKINLDGLKQSSFEIVDDESKIRSDALRLELKEKAFLSGPKVEEGIFSYFNIFLLGFLGGFLALLTPCVFPMIPLTVSYFLKQSSSNSRGLINASVYAIFIVLIYLILSLPFHFIDSLNPEFLNTIATNIFLNLIFFVVFIIFAFSFFGFYELTLPTSWSMRTDNSSSLNTFIGIFFMALTLAIVSFSCTGPILGSLLAGSLTSEGGAFQLSIGMLGFGLALGLPFGLLAIFPNSLKKFPKSGSWMNSVKVILGFLELALALKFLSNADLVAGWGILKREIFLGLWIILTFMLTLYLLGFIKFPNQKKESISKFRYFFSSLSFAFTMYLLVGLFSKDNTLKFLSGFPPPVFYSFQTDESDCPLGLECYKDFEIGREKAFDFNKPILLDFTGWACVNCRKMEENVWSEPRVYSLLKDNFIIISLYVDDRKKLDISDQFDYQYPNGSIRKINTVGKKWATFQAINFKTASQPFYILMNPDGTLLNTPIQYVDSKTFYKWLEIGLENQSKIIPKVKYLNFSN